MLALEREEKQAVKAASEVAERTETQTEKAAARAQKEAKKKWKENKKYMKVRCCAAVLPKEVTMVPYDLFTTVPELEEAIENDKKSPPYWMAAVLILVLGFYCAFVRK